MGTASSTFTDSGGRLRSGRHREVRRQVRRVIPPDLGCPQSAGVAAIPVQGLRPLDGGGSQDHDTQRMALAVAALAPPETPPHDGPQPVGARRDIVIVTRRQPPTASVVTSTARPPAISRPATSIPAHAEVPKVRADVKSRELALRSPFECLRVSGTPARRIWWAAHPRPARRAPVTLATLGGVPGAYLSPPFMMALTSAGLMRSGASQPSRPYSAMHCSAKPL